MIFKTNRLGSWSVLAMLLSLLVVAIVFAVVGWGKGDVEPGQSVTTAGYAAMTFGIVATLALGIGLMALVFYSSRKGHD